MTRFWKVLALTGMSGGYLMQVCVQKQHGWSLLPNLGSGWTNLLNTFNLTT